MATTTKAETNSPDLFERVKENADFLQLRDEIKRGGRIVSLSGLTSGAAKALILTALQRELAKLLLSLPKQTIIWNTGTTIFAFGAPGWSVKV